MRPVGLVLALLLAVSSGGSAALRPRIVNGVTTSAYPTVGALLVGSSPATAWLGCSGTLIGCRTFLTAAHCVCDRTGPACQPGGGSAPDPRRFFVFLQHGGIVGVESVAVHESYAFPVADVAVLRLSAPVVGIGPSPLNTAGRPPGGTAGTIVGFGRQGLGIDDFGLKRVGAVTVSPCVTVPADSSVCWQFLAPLGPPGTNANTCEGDSGGPLFVDAGGGVVVAGITSGGETSECQPPDEGYDADVFRYRDWIAARAGSDLGQPRCGSGPHVGESGTHVEALEGALDATTPAATFALDVPAGLGSLRFALNGDERADFDLYVRREAPPTTAVFDCKDNGPSQFAACVVPAPAPGRWHALVQRYTGNGAFQLTVTLLADQDACRELPDGTPCDDGNACTHGDVCGAGACRGLGTPRSGCLLAAGRGGSLGIRDSARPGRDLLVWRWARGSISPAALAAPGPGSDYTLCLYDSAAGTARLVSRQRIPGSAGWRATASGWRYSDRRAAADGVTRAVLAAGLGNDALLLVKARGPALAAPPLPLARDPGVTAQLIGPTGCFETRHSGAQVNDATRFRAIEP